MADVSPKEAEEETVVVAENESQSSNSNNNGDSGLKEVKKEGKENVVSTDLVRSSEEQEGASRSEHEDKNWTDKEDTKPILKDDVAESSPQKTLSSNEEQINTSEGIPDSGSSAEDENKEDAVPVAQDIRPSVQESELLVVDDDTQMGQTEDTSTLTEPEIIQSLYHIKWMKWKGLNTPVITQNENGPCPLIAIINALILQRKISIPAMQEIISANQLMEYLGDCIFMQAPEVRTSLFHTVCAEGCLISPKITEEKKRINETNTRIRWRQL